MTLFRLDEDCDGSGCRAAGNRQIIMTNTESPAQVCSPPPGSATPLASLELAPASLASEVWSEAELMSRGPGASSHPRLHKRSPEADPSGKSPST